MAERREDGGDAGLARCSLPALAMDSQRFSRALMVLGGALGMEACDGARNELTQISNWVWNCIFSDVS